MATLNEIDICMLRKVISYNPHDGRAFWKERGAELFASSRSRSAQHRMKNWNSRFAGMSVGSVPSSKDGYKRVSVFGVQLLVHRVVWAVYHGTWPEGFIDHVNGVRCDNRICNLKDVTMQGNSMNSAKRADNTTGINGVLWSKRRAKYYARATVAGKQFMRGYFSDIEDAKMARAELNARLGFSERHGK